MVVQGTHYLKFAKNIYLGYNNATRMVIDLNFKLPKEVLIRFNCLLVDLYEHLYDGTRILPACKASQG